MKRDFIYDIETYLDLFCVAFVHAETRERWIFEVSERMNQSPALIRFLHDLRQNDARLFGFNNVGFDWPVLQPLMLDQRGYFFAQDGHRLANMIIGSQDRFGHIIWPDDRMVTQGDLFLIHHFDNVARSTSLKKLEIAMRSRNVVDLPYPPDQPTTDHQKDEIVSYMCHDVSETLRFYAASMDAIAFRDELAKEYPDMGDVLNMNDTKIGKRFFLREIERNGTPVYEHRNGRREPIQTRRATIPLGNVISPRVTFQRPEFATMLDWFRAQTISGTDTKGVFKDLHCTVEGVEYHFGVGGLHAAAGSGRWETTETRQVQGRDVASYYPNLAISNRFHPEHLGDHFCDIYERVYQMRRGYAKDTAQNAMLKLALNGVYGDSNNHYSSFYDPQYTMAITINGQLMLCMLIEQLLSVPTLEMIQANTDGLEYAVDKPFLPMVDEICKAWEEHTGLELETENYVTFIQRDVNSYIADTGKSVKRIGAYAYQTPFDVPGFQTRERDWHKDHSMLVIRKAAEAQMLHGVPVRDFIMQHRDPFDFMLSVKVPRSSRLETTDGTVIQNTTRYYVSTDGHGLVKVMPPLKGKTDERRIGVQQGWMVTVVNDADLFRWDNVNWLFYITEAEKLVI